MRGPRVYIMCMALLLSSGSRSQEKIGELKIPGKLQKGNTAIGYPHTSSGGMVVNLQSYNEISRHLFDSNLKLVSSYRVPTNKYALSNSASFIPQFAIEVNARNHVYEVYSTEKSATIIKPDFERKVDEVIYTFDLKAHNKDERRLAVMPFREGLRILSYSPKAEKLYLYQWSESGIPDTIDFELPPSSLSEEEEKTMTKYARVKYKQSLENMTVTDASTAALISNPALNSIFYDEDKIWILSMMVSYGGYNLLELDLSTFKITSSNFLVNDMKKNSDSKPETVRIPYATVTRNYLIIRNSSNYYFEYLVYDLRSKQKIRSFVAGPDEEIKTLLHSEFLQRGTWLSGKEEKDINNEKAFLRKLSSGQGFLFASRIEDDSLTITTGSVKAVQGIEGLAMGIATGLLLPGFIIGPYRVMLYLTTFRNKLSYAHTRFSLPDFRPSMSQNIRSGLDYLLDNFEKKDLEANSSFIMKRKDEYLLAVFNKLKLSFEVFRMDL